MKPLFAVVARASSREQLSLESTHQTIESAEERANTLYNAGWCTARAGTYAECKKDIAEDSKMEII